MLVPLDTSSGDNVLGLWLDILNFYFAEIAYEIQLQIAWNDVLS